ncbi:DEKNAAC103147 [Brettanomyces naardenensis]|uniref:DEKNAAC103147 n=1 Tax=Brettanomyces naardenensis TaxID=13370 RepID=A0A448YMP9_BRENA|nr:DEKNAAC103147 [Brettanomyces naardenensis]
MIDLKKFVSSRPGSSASMGSISSTVRRVQNKLLHTKSRSPRKIVTAFDNLNDVETENDESAVMPAAELPLPVDFPFITVEPQVRSSSVTALVAATGQTTSLIDANVHSYSSTRPSTNRSVQNSLERHLEVQEGFIATTQIVEVTPLLSEDDAFISFDRNRRHSWLDNILGRYSPESEDIEFSSPEMVDPDSFKRWLRGHRMAVSALIVGIVMIICILIYV